MEKVLGPSFHPLNRGKGLMENSTWRRPVVALALVWILTAPVALAQGPGGKVEGVVREPDGTPIGSAQITIPGTAFGATTSARGYYFINSVPAGLVAIRARFVGHRPVEIQDIRILAGQTITQDITLEPAPLQLQAIDIVAAQNPLVPRDEVTTKQRVDADFTERLPVDRIAEVLQFQPGVVTTQRGQLTIRGGRPDESILYVDGVPVSPGYRLDTPGFLGLPPTTIEIGTNAFEEASVTTGAISAEYGNAQSGVIAIQTRSGGSRFQGNFGYETDEVFGVNHGLGINRFTASIGGPVVGGITFFLSGVVNGQRSAEGGPGGEKSPLFIAAGIDTTVAVPSALNDPLADTTQVQVLQFAAFRGGCDQFRQSANPGIASNYGIKCQGIRIPWSASSGYQLSGKLSYTYGRGSRLAVSAHASQDQSRDFDYGNAYDPQNIAANRSVNSVLGFQWSQNLARSSERALTLDVYLSYQQDHTLNGPLTVEGEIKSRDPSLGIHLASYDFLYDFDNFPITEELVNNFLRQQGTRTPFDLDRPDDYAVSDIFRNNAYGLNGFSDKGGPDGFLSLQEEHRTIGRVVLDWQADRQNRVKLGGDVTKYYNGFYSHGLTNSGAADVWIRRPYRWNAFVEDRLDLGDVVVVGGLRYDFYDSKGRHPVWYDSTSGRFLYFPRISTNPDFDPRHPNAIFRSYHSHSYLSPHIQVSFPVTTNTNFRFSYAHQVQVPDFASILRRANTDFQLSGGLYGSDLDFARTIIFEFGARHSFGSDMVLDIAAYHKNKLSDVTGRSIPLLDPRTQSMAEVQRLTTADYGIVRGVDIRLDRRIGTLFNGFIGYTYQDAKNTGDDPLSYLNRQSVLVSTAGGGLVLPPQSILTARDSRPHNLTGAFSLQFPHDWKQGSLIGWVLQSTGLNVIFRYASGTAYTRCETTAGNESFTSENGGCSFQLNVGQFNGARLPSTKQVDLRFTKGLNLRGLDLTAYLDARNVFNFRNIITVFSAYGGIVSKPERDKTWASDSAAYIDEAAAAGVLDLSGGMDLRFGGAVASGCSNWVRQNGLPAAPNCVYLIRAEERYGNGDHIFDLTEMRRASDALYEVFRGSQNFSEAPRRLRVGLEINF